MNRQCPDNTKRKSNMSQEARERLSKARMGCNNPAWKGDNVKYNALHDWVKWHKPPTFVCEICGRGGKVDIANISGEYKRDLADWEYLCRRCHMIKDGRMEQFKKTRKPFKKRGNNA